jgi:hypothetical protein
MVTSPFCKRTFGAALAALIAQVGLGCQPEFVDRASAIATERVLAVRSVPAEGAPTTTIQYTALVGDVRGTRTDVPIDWAYCTLPKPVSETNDINTLCFGTGPFIKPFGAAGHSVSADIPSGRDNACNQFGPDLPDIPGQPPGRPADPDSTGGYYQPIRLAVNQGNHFDFSVGETRLTCNLPGATTEVLVDYRNRYRPNENPEVASLVASTAPDVPLMPEAMGDSGLAVSPGATVSLTASWLDCPTEPACGNGFCEANEDTVNCAADCMVPVGCTGSEPYVSFDLATRTLVARREAMRVSWYANGGSFVDDRTGRTEEETALLSTTNTWTAPSTAGTVTIWVVLRDSRGGIGWKSYRVAVQ